MPTDRSALHSEAVDVTATARTGAAVREFTAMTNQQQATFPPTLVFNSVDAFVAAVQTRSITEIGCVLLQRSTPFEGGMLERRTSFAQAAYHVHPDVCMRFAEFTVDEASEAENS